MEQQQDSRVAPSCELRVSALGPLVVSVDGDEVAVPRGQPIRLLAILISAGGRFVSVDSLRERLWPGAEPRSRATVQSHVRRVREALGPAAAAIETGGDRGYRLVTAGVAPGVVVELDADRFRQLVAAAQASIADEAWDDARSALDAALALWRSDTPLPDLDDDLDARPWAVSLSETRDWADRQAADLAIRAGDVWRVIPSLEARLARDPTDQRSVASLMRAYAASGRPERASGVYDELVRRLGRDLGEVPLRELSELDGRILRHDPELVGLGDRHEAEATPEQPPVPPRPSAFGAAITTFVGRRGELERLTALVGQARLVTVVGPGGAGKTRLAHELGRRVERPGGVFLAQLASCADGDLAGVLDRVTQTMLSAEHQRVASPSRLAGALAEEVSAPTLLVLDNCEHVLDPVAVLAVTLLEAVPDLQLLLTSRETLQVPGERRLALAPLPLAPTATDTVLDATSGEAGPSDSARLFLDRAAAGGWQPQSTPSELRSIEAVCRHLGGLPLGIELVAPLLAFHRLDELEERVAEMPFLGEVRSPHLRQRSIEEIVAWSFDRLGDEERRLLLAAGTFSGGFDRAAVIEVADEVWPDVGGAGWASAFDRLAARSLLTAGSGAPGHGNRLVEPVRAYVRRVARESGAVGALGDAHAARFATFAAEAAAGAAERGLGMPLPAVGWLDDVADLRAALLWCVETGADERGLALLDAVGLRVYGLGLTPAVLAWLRRLADDEAHATVALDLLTTHAMFAGELDELERLTSRTLDALAGTDDLPRRGRALVIAALAHVLAGRYAVAGGHLAEAREVLAVIEDAWLTGWADSVDSMLLRREGRWEESEVAANRSIGEFRAIGDRLGQVLPVLTLGRLAAATGDPKRGIELLDDGIAEAVRLGERLLVATGSAYAAVVHAQMGEPVDAVRRLVVVLRLLRGTPHRVLLGNAVEQAATVAALAGMPEDAAILLGFSESHRPVPRPHELPLLDELASGLGEPDFAAAVRTGAAMDPEAAIDLAIDRLGAAVDVLAE